MRFNPKARLDTSRTRDVGGSGGGLGGGGLGGGGVSLPTGKMGAGGIVVVLVLVILGQCTGVGPDLGSILGSASGSTLDASRFSTEQGGTERYASCKSGEDANNNADCALVAVENSLYDYWGNELGGQFRPETGVHTFTGAVSTGGCGNATTDVGPFYCPTDQTIYLDTSFYRDMLEGQLGGKDAPFVRAYVIAHEYGHHIQNLLGIMGQVRTQQGPKSDSVKLELQADCFAGMWAQAAQTTPDQDGNVLISDLSESDITDAIGAATAVGDDYIEKRMSGGVNPEKWTHGSSAQRVKWFKTGMASGNDVNACDTFAPGAV
ncbi:neutral zinc metallopeptidase [Nocardioides sp. CER19]|uniref:KPN_02809 family neutral zinc metallopeptidase n=1 Tax=Nocardioides sp. CER19 TaxID=3038538 RepID=UPI00244BCC7D|nr:neutral zinc metallopeptidase [Nocardioides sp. CER19]MDH2415765.1 neutral zinc metallopeptidase [Nocardioides sp. CER19]